MDSIYKLFYLFSVSPLQINVDMNSRHSSLHILYPNSSGQMETVGSFLEIDNINGQYIAICAIFLDIQNSSSNF